MKSKHMLNYHALTQGESESGPEFVNCELREYLALRDMGVHIDDSIRLTKFIQQDTTNSKHKQLAQTIFTTPNMTLGRAASLFETYNPPSGPAAPTTPTVNAVICRYCKGKDHNLSDCPKKKPVSDHKKAENPYSPSFARFRPAKRQMFPCAISNSMDHLPHLCPRRNGISLSPPAGRIHHLPRTGSHPSGGARQSEAGGVMMNSLRVLSDGVVRDEVTQLRSLRKLRFCL